MKRAARQGGFTLLEILVALVVLGLLMAALAQGTQFGIRAWNNQSGNVIRNSDLDTTDRTLRTLLTRMQPPPEPDQPSLQGQADQLQFTSELPQGAPLAPPRLAQISVLVDASHRLLLRWVSRPHAKLIGPSPPVHDDVLLNGVARLAVSYRARDTNWSSTWTTPALPQLIRLHLTLTAPGRQWPDILVAPMRDSISETGE